MLVAVAAETVFLIEPADKPQGAVYIDHANEAGIGIGLQNDVELCVNIFPEVCFVTYPEGGKFAIGLSEAVKRVRRHDCVKVYAYVANCFIAPVSGQKERYAKNFPVTPAWAHKAKTAENKTIKSFFIAIKIFLEFRG